MSEAAHTAGTWSALERANFIAPDHDTARTLGQYRWMPRVLLPPLEPVEAVIDALESVVHENEEVLLLLAEGAEGPWPALLRELGARVTETRTWRADPQGPSIEVWAAAAVTTKAIVVHSPAAAEALIRGCPEADWAKTRFVATGPATEHALTHLGVTVCATAARPSADGVLDATLRALSAEPYGVRELVSAPNRSPTKG
jgi:uroporphyrinogen-III synthase